MVTAIPRSRSKSGCLTCRGCKVKCDEFRPVCKRCVRLNLTCEYIPDGAAVRIHDRRIGAGPIKKRQYTGWRPPRLAAAPPAALPSPCIQTGQTGQAAPFAFSSLFPADPFACDPGPATCAPLTSVPTQDDFMFLSGFQQDDFLATSGAFPIDAFLSADFISSGDMGMYDVGSVESDDCTAAAPPLSTPTLSLSTSTSTPASTTMYLPLSLRLGTTAIVLSAFNSRARLTEQDYDALYLFHNHVGFSVGSKSPMWSTHAILIKLSVHHSAILHFLLAASYTERHWRRGQPETDEYLSSDNYDEAARAHYVAGETALAEMTEKAKLGGDNPLYHVVVIACFWLEYLINRRRDGRARNLLRGRGRSSTGVTAYRRWATTDDFSRAMGDHVQAYSLRKSLMGYTKRDTHDRDSRDSTPEDDFEINQSQNQPEQVPAKMPPQMYRSFLSRLLSWLYWYDCTTAFFGQGGQLAKQFQLRSHAGQTLLHVPIYKSKYKSHVDSFYETARTTLFDFWQGNYTPAEVADDNANWPALQLINETWVIVHALNLLEEADPKDRPDKLDLIVRNARELRSRHQVVFWLSQQSEQGHRSGSTDNDNSSNNNKTAAECARSRQLAMADWAVCHQLALELHVIRAGGFSSTPPTKIAAQIIQFAERAIRTVGPVELDRFQWSLFWAGTATDDAVYRSFVMKHMINANFRAVLGVVHARADRATLSLAELRAICRSVALDY